MSLIAAFLRFECLPGHLSVFQGAGTKSGESNAESGDWSERGSWPPGEVSVSITVGAGQSSPCRAWGMEDAPDGDLREKGPTSLENLGAHCPQTTQHNGPSGDENIDPSFPSIPTPC